MGEDLVALLNKLTASFRPDPVKTDAARAQYLAEVPFNQRQYGPAAAQSIDQNIDTFNAQGAQQRNAFLAPILSKVGIQPPVPEPVAPADGVKLRLANALQGRGI